MKEPMWTFDVHCYACFNICYVATGIVLPKLDSVVPFCPVQHWVTWLVVNKYSGCNLLTYQRPLKRC